MRSPLREARAWRSDVTPEHPDATRSPSQASSPKERTGSRRTARAPPRALAYAGGELSGSRGLARQLAWDGSWRGRDARAAEACSLPPATSAAPASDRRRAPGGSRSTRLPEAPQAQPSAPGKQEDQPGVPATKRRRPAAPLFPRQPTPRLAQQLTHPAQGLRLRDQVVLATSARHRCSRASQNSTCVPRRFPACCRGRRRGGVEAHESLGEVRLDPAVRVPGAHGVVTASVLRPPSTPSTLRPGFPEREQMSTIALENSSQCPARRTKGSRRSDPAPRPEAHACTGALPPASARWRRPRRPGPCPRRAAAPGPGRGASSSGGTARSGASRPHSAARVRAGRGGPAPPVDCHHVAQILPPRAGEKRPPRCW